MIERLVTGRTYVFIDASNIYHSLLKYMRSFRKNCIVVSTKDHVSVELLRQAKFIDIKRLKNDFELKGQKI